MCHSFVIEQSKWLKKLTLFPELLFEDLLPVGVAPDLMVVKSERNTDDGVDLSFDTVKKENFEIKVESREDISVKEEYRSTGVLEEYSDNSSSQKTSNGGRLKFFKGREP